MDSRPVYPGSVLLLEVDKNVKKYLKNQRRKQVKEPQEKHLRRSERISGGLLPLWLPAKPQIENDSSTTIGIFPAKRPEVPREETPASRQGSRGGIRQAFDSMRIRDDGSLSQASTPDIMAPVSTPRPQKSLLITFNVDQSSLPLADDICWFSSSLVDLAASRKLLESMRQCGEGSTNIGRVGMLVAKHFNAGVVDTEEEETETVSEKKEVTNDSENKARIVPDDCVPRSRPPSIPPRGKYSGIKRAVYLVDREPSCPRHRSHQNRPKTASLLLGVSGKHLLPIGRLPNEEDKALRHLVQVEDAIDAVLKQVQTALHEQLNQLFDQIGPIVRKRSYITLTPGNTIIELDVPQEQRKVEATWMTRHASFGEDTYYSQSYRRKIRPLTAATTDPAGCGLEIVGTTAPTKSPSLPIPFCFMRVAATPSPNSSVQLIFVPTLGDVPGTDQAIDFGLDSVCVAQSDIVFKSWGILYGFRRTSVSSDKRVAVLEYVGEASASVTGTVSVVPSQAAIRFLATVRRIQQNSLSSIHFRGVAYLPVWTSLSGDQSLAENCLLALVCFFDCEPTTTDTAAAAAPPPADSDTIAPPSNAPNDVIFPKPDCEEERN